MSALPLVLASLSLGIWIGLAFFRGAFWRLDSCDDDLAQHTSPSEWPAVVAIIPARNEAETIAQTVTSLLKQEYPGEFRVVVVDDHSDDGTGDLALLAAQQAGAAERVEVRKAEALPAGWTGKLWAMEQGSQLSETDSTSYLWFTDADIVHAPETLRNLISRAASEDLDLTSLMVLLQAHTLPERLLIPPFLYFFLKLYPPRWIARPESKTAGAAGGCVLLRRSALNRIGGFAAIRKEVIDDCSLARDIKSTGGKIWMGLTRRSVSLRFYGTFAQIRDMVARTAFTQLGYSTLQLAGTLLGMFLTYLVPVFAAFHPQPAVGRMGLAAWVLMAMTFLPTVRFYGLNPLTAPTLPFAAAYYTYATWLSAFRYWTGKGGQWKGRSQAPRE